MKGFFVLQLLSLLIFTSCVGNKKLNNYKVTQLPKLEKPYHIGQVTILDKRTYTTAEEMKIPFLSTPRMFIQHSPALKPEHRDLIEATIRENTMNSGRLVNAVIIIEEAYKEFSANWVSEKERGYARFQVVFYDQDNIKSLARSTASGEFFVRSMDATHRRMEAVYQITIKNALHNCLQQVDKQSIVRRQIKQDK